MNVFDYFTAGACNLDGRYGTKSWDWKTYFQKRKELEEQGVDIILVDMIDHPVDGSTPISNELFTGNYPEGTYFVLYCHSGATSGSLQKKLAPEFPHYEFINLEGGIRAYYS